MSPPWAPSHGSPLVGDHGRILLRFSRATPKGPASGTRRGLTHQAVGSAFLGPLDAPRTTTAAESEAAPSPESCVKMLPMRSLRPRSSRTQRAPAAMQRDSRERPRACARDHERAGPPGSAAWRTRAKTRRGVPRPSGELVRGLREAHESDREPSDGAPGRASELRIARRVQDRIRLAHGAREQGLGRRCREVQEAD